MIFFIFSFITYLCTQDIVFSVKFSIPFSFIFDFAFNHFFSTSIFSSWKKNTLIINDKKKFISNTAFIFGFIFFLWLGLFIQLKIIFSEQEEFFYFLAFYILHSTIVNNIFLFFKVFHK